MPGAIQTADLNTAVYDAWNRMVQIRDGASGPIIGQYEYDGRNFRTRKKVYTSGTLSETKDFYYTDRWQVIEERLTPSAGSQRLSSQWVWRPNYVDDLICRDHDTNGDGTLDKRQYCCQDDNFNVVAVVDSSVGGTAGSVARRYAYEPYGTPIVLNASFVVVSSTASTWEARYAGCWYDTESGLYCVRHRYLHPRLGRWVTRDPLGYVDGQNVYQYMSGNSIHGTDAAGLAPWDPHGPLHLSLPVKFVGCPSYYIAYILGNYVFGFMLSNLVASCPWAKAHRPTVIIDCDCGRERGYNGVPLDDSQHKMRICVDPPGERSLTTLRPPPGGISTLVHEMTHLIQKCKDARWYTGCANQLLAETEAYCEEDQNNIAPCTDYAIRLRYCNAACGSALDCGDFNTCVRTCEPMFSPGAPGAPVPPVKYECLLPSNII